MSDVPNESYDPRVTASKGALETLQTVVVMFVLNGLLTGRWVPDLTTKQAIAALVVVALPGVWASLKNWLKQAKSVAVPKWLH